MKMPRSLGVGILVSVLAASGLVACGGGEQGAASRAPVSAAEKEGGLAVVCSAAGIETLDPFVSPDLMAGDLRLLLFTPLVLYGEDGGEFQPYLAKDWTWSEDRTRLTFHLRNDITWDDGVPLTAADVAWTVQAAANPAYGYQGGPDLEGLAEATTPDSFTVELHFGKPLTAGLEPFVGLPILPRHLLADLSPDAFQKADYQRSPVGSGPFRFAERRPDGSIVFERADSFPEDLGRPYLDRIVVRAIPEATSLATELASGGVDMCVTGSDLADRLGSLAGVRVIPLRPPGVQTIFLNTRHPPLDDARVRRALSAGLERGQIAGVTSPIARIARNPLVPSSPWFDSTLVQPDADSTLAASLLDEAGWTRPAGDEIRHDGAGDPLRITLATPPTLETAMTVAQAQLRRVGVDVQLQFMEYASFISTIMNPDSRPDAMTLGFYQRVVRPDLYSLFHSQGEQNLSGYADPGMDAVLDSLRTATDPTRVRELYGEVQRRVARDVPMVYTLYVPRLLAVGPRIQDVSANLNGPFASVAEWWIEPARRRAE